MGTFIFVSSIIPVVLLIVIGLLIKYKKAYWLISGYNTMPVEKKKNVDIEGLGKFAANVCFIIAGILFAASIFMSMQKFIIAMIIFVFLIPVVTYILIKEQQYDGNSRDHEGKMKKKTKALIGSISGFLVIIAIGVGVLIYNSSLPIGITLESGILKISGIYGQELPIYEINSIELKETIPEILIKTNGSSLNTMLKGNFKLKELGDAKLYIDASKPPFIYIRNNTGLFIMNCNDTEETKRLYGRLKEEWEKTSKR